MANVSSINGNLIVVGTSGISDGAVTNAKLGASSVTTDKLASGAVDTTDIASSAVTVSKLADGAVTNAKLATSAVSAEKLAGSSVTTEKIANGAVTTGKIADGAVTLAKIGSDVTLEPPDGSITTAKLANGSVTDDKLAQSGGVLDELDNMRDSLISAVTAGAAQGGYGDAIESASGRETYTNSYSGNSSAYWNGITVPRGSRVTGIAINSNCTSTRFSLYYFDSDFTYLGEITDIEPTITEGVFELDTPIEFIDFAGLVMVRFIDGTWYANRHSSNDLIEYRTGTASLTDSPLQACYDVIYEQIETVEFLFGTASQINLAGFSMPKTVLADSGSYTLIGRWFDKNDHKCANADGSSILFKVSGASALTVDFSTLSEPEYTPYFAYSVDGSAFTRQLITNQSVAMPDTGEHLVWIAVDGMGETDPTAGKWSGTVGLQLNGISGGTLKAVEVKNKSILFVGDSIVEGINALGTGANANVNSATSGFAWKTAHMLNAIPLLCGYGGSSTIGGGSFNTAINAVQYNMNGVPVNEMEPDIILIEHGYNDNSVIRAEVKTVADFISAYSALIERLSIMYTGVPIICMIPFKQSLAEYIRNIASDYGNCYVIETASYTVEYSDNAHPSAIGATHAAESLSADIARLMGKQFFIV